MRPTVALVSAHWGPGDDESEATARLLAGALSRRAEVEVLHLVPAPVDGPQVVADSVFRVRRLPVHRSARRRAGIIRAALSAGGGPLARPTATLLERYEGEAPDVPETLERLAPRSVVLVGSEQPFDLDALDARGLAATRLVVVPLLGEPARVELPHVRAMLERAEVVATVHPGEQRALGEALPAAGPRQIAPLDLTFTINRAAARHRLFGVRRFGRYVVLLRAFPTGQPRHPKGITREMLQHVLGRVSVAEVDESGWKISDARNTLPLPVNPTRVNLWRLMEHAAFTIDLRPPGPLGREAIESLLLGTPVLVPEQSAAREHARAAQGGLWYRDLGELLDAARVLLDRPIRDRLGTQGEAYAAAHHADMADFVERAARLVLG